MCDLYMGITSEGNRRYKYRKWSPGLWVGGGRHQRGWTGTVMPITVLRDLTAFMWSLSSKKRANVPFSPERKFKKLRKKPQNK